MKKIIILLVATLFIIGCDDGKDGAAGIMGPSIWCTGDPAKDEGSGCITHASTQGKIGIPGSQGKIGVTGLTGDKGAASTVVGPIGLTGNQGNPGIHGDTGPAGPAGPVGCDADKTRNAAGICG